MSVTFPVLIDISCHFSNFRDFANDQVNSEIDTRDSIAAFTEFGFRSHYRRVNNGDLLSRAGVLDYEVLKELQEPSEDLKARVPSFFGKPPRCQEAPTSETSIAAPFNSISLDLSGAPFIARNATSESGNGGRPGGFRDERLLHDVAVCMLDNMK